MCEVSPHACNIMHVVQWMLILFCSFRDFKLYCILAATLFYYILASFCPRDIKSLSYSEKHFQNKWQLAELNRCLSKALAAAECLVLFHKRLNVCHMPFWLLKPYVFIVVLKNSKCTVAHSEKELSERPGRPSAIFRNSHFSRALFNYIWDKLTVIMKL